MPLLPKDQLDQLQDDFLNGNFVAPNGNPLPPSLSNLGINDNSVIKCSIAGYFKREEVETFLPRLGTNKYVKIFFVKTGDDELSFAMAGANDAPGGGKPTNAIFPENLETPYEEEGLIAERPCPPFCQDEKSAAAQTLFVIKA